MAWTGLASAASAGTSKTAGTSITTQYSNGIPGFVANAYAVIVLVALDNVQTTDGNTSLVSAVSDGVLTYTKIGEFTNGQGGAASGATIVAWYADGTVALAASGTRTVTVTHGSVTARAVAALAFNRTSVTLPVVTQGTPVTVADDGIDPSSIAISGLGASQEYLFIRAAALEAASGTSITPTGSWNATKSATQGTTGGSGVTNMSIAVEYQIATATSATSNPTVGAADGASIIFALGEISSIVTHVATGALTGQGSTIVGSAAHIAIHTSTGALIGPSSTVAGTAAHISVHTSSGALVGQIGSIAGTAS